MVEGRSLHVLVGYYIVDKTFGIAEDLHRDGRSCNVQYGVTENFWLSKFLRVNLDD